MQKNLDIGMIMYSLIEYSNNCAKTSGYLCQDPKHNPNDQITGSKSFKYKARITERTPDFEIAVPLK